MLEKWKNNGHFLFTWNSCYNMQIIIVLLGFSCESGFRRNKRSTDIQTEMAKKGVVLLLEPFVSILKATESVIVLFIYYIIV